MKRTGTKPSLAEQTETAARTLLRPILRLLFNRGLPRRTLMLLCDEAYVEAAAAKLRQEDREVSLKSVARLSELSLTKVKQLKTIVDRQARLDAAPIGERAPLVSAATRVLTGWHSDAAFTDEQGRPVPLRSDGHRFDQLIQRYGNGCTHQAIVDVLMATESASLNGQGMLEPKRRAVLAAPHSEQIDLNALEAFADLARAIEVNRQKQRPHTGAVQRTCANERMPERIAPIFRNMIRENSQNFLELIDDWLVQHESADETNSSDERLVRLGVGIYVINDH